MKIIELIHEIRNQNLVLPEFQREYVWSKDQAKQLMVSLLEGYPIGGILLWKTQHPPELKNIEKNDDRLGTYQLILDGQQRLTTLYLIITGEIPPYYQSEDIKTDVTNLFFNIENGDFSFYQPVRMRNEPTWVSVKDCFTDNMSIPFDVADKVFPDDREALQNATKKFSGFLQKLKNIENIDIPEQVIPPNALLDEAIDIFDRVNSQGTSLTEAELALTHVTGKWPQARRILKDKMDRLASSHFDFDLNFMTRCLTVLSTDHALFNQIHNTPKDIVEKQWEHLSNILDYLLKILSTHGHINSTHDLSTTNALVPLVKYLALHGGKFPDQKSLRNALHWLYIALILQRYTGQTDQRLERDVNIIVRESNPWNSLLDQIIDLRGRISVSANDFEGRGIHHPLYKMSFILVKSRQAIDWFNGITLGSGPITEDRYKIHSHHIFPISLLYKNGYNPSNHTHIQTVNAISNRAFLTGDTNLRISNRSPEEYLPEVEDKYPGALESQLVPQDRILWKLENYKEFLSARRELITDTLNEYLNSLITEQEEEGSTQPTIELINLGEGPNIEFKSTLQWDIKQNKKNPELRRAVLKTLVAFMNSDGGTLLIGVEDSGEIFGIEKDLGFDGNSTDKFINRFTQMIISDIGMEHTNLVQPKIEKVHGYQICVVNVSKSTNPAYLNGDFFIRVQNTTRQLDAQETTRFLENGSL